MKKIIALLLVIATLATLCACGAEKKENEVTEAENDTAVAETTAGTDEDEKTEPKAEGYSFRKITDYLFEGEIDGYEQYRGEADKFFNQYRPKAGGCSCVQNGKIRGRNYDWTFDEEPEFVLHVPAAEGRHASLGVAATTEITAADVENGKDFDIYRIIPYITLDGINDAGLTVNINVVGFGEKGEFEMKTPDDETDDVCPLMIPRLLLDGAGSIDEALEMLSAMDIYSVGNAEEAHYMISGAQSADDDTFNTVVVELIPDENKHYQLSVLDYNKGDFVDDKPVMTNFHLTDFDGTVESATKHPMGFERWQELFENYDQGVDVPGMLDLMKKVYYSRNYDLFNDNFWYSEYAVGDLDMTMTGEKNLMGDISKAGAFAGEVEKGHESYLGMKRDATTWRTVHTSVYDIENATLYLVPQEGGFCYEFKLESKPE